MSEVETRFREVDLNNYWPQVIGETEQFKTIAEAQNPPLNEAWGNLFDGIDETFVSTATIYGIERFEKMFGIVPRPGATLEERRERILAVLNARAPYTFRSVRRMLIEIIGAENLVRYSYDNDSYELAVYVDSSQQGLDDSINDLFNITLPANVILRLRYV